MQLEPLFSLKEKSGEVELFHFISIFLSSAGKVRGRAAPPARAAGGQSATERVTRSFGGLNIAFPESHDHGKEGTDLPIIQPKWQSDMRKLNFFTLFPFFFHQLAKFEAGPPASPLERPVANRLPKELHAALEA